MQKHEILDKFLIQIIVTCPIYFLNNFEKVLTVFIFIDKTRT